MLPLLLIFVLYKLSQISFENHAGLYSPIYPVLWSILGYLSFYLLIGVLMVVFGQNRLIAALIAAAVSIAVVYILSQIVARALPKKDIRKTPKKANNTNWTFWGWTLAGLFTVFVLSDFVVAASDESVEVKPNNIAIAIFMTLTVIQLIMVDAIRMNKKRKIHSDNVDFLSSNKKYILFLRNFEDSKRRIFARGKTKTSFWENASGITVDEYISNGLGERAKFVSLGDPNDFIPELGSAKIYVSDDDWKQKITNYIDGAEKIIILEGSSSSLAWELKHIRYNIAPQKIFFATMPKSNPFGGVTILIPNKIVGFFLKKRRANMVDVQYKKYQEDLHPKFRSFLFDAGFNHKEVKFSPDAVYGVDKNFNLYPLVEYAKNSAQYVKPLA